MLDDAHREHVAGFINSQQQIQWAAIAIVSNQLQHHRCRPAIPAKAPGGPCGGKPEQRRILHAERRDARVTAVAEFSEQRCRDRVGLEATRLQSTPDEGEQCCQHGNTRCGAQVSRLRQSSGSHGIPRHVRQEKAV